MTNMANAASLTIVRRIGRVGGTPARIVASFAVAAGLLSPVAAAGDEVPSCAAQAFSFSNTPISINGIAFWEGHSNAVASCTADIEAMMLIGTAVYAGGSGAGDRGECTSCDTQVVVAGPAHVLRAHPAVCWSYGAFGSGAVAVWLRGADVQRDCFPIT